MENTLEITLHETGELVPLKDGAASLGSEMESGATKLRVDLPASVIGKRHFLEFLKPDGTAVSTPAIAEETDGANPSVKFISLSAGNALTDIPGRYALQYVGRDVDSSIVLKSRIIYLDVDPSINATAFVAESDPDFIAWATKKIADLTAKVGGLDDDPTDDPATKEELTAEADRAKGAEEANTLAIGANSNAISAEALRATGVESGHASRIKTLEDLINSNVFFYGAKFYDGDTSGERLGAAIGLQAGVNGQPNDFDHMPLYKDITTYTDASGNEIVKVGRSFYHKRFHGGTSGQSGYWFAECISPFQIDSSWGLHDAFVDKNGSDRGYFTIGRYMASANAGGTKLVTVTGALPKTSLTPTQARALAAAGGAHLCENRKFDALGLLFRIEFATNDGQSVFSGISYSLSIYPTDNAPRQLGDTGNTVVCSTADNFSGNEAEWAKAFGVGTPINVWNDNEGGFVGEVNRHVTAISFVDGVNPDGGAPERRVQVTISGSPINLIDTTEYYACVQNFSPLTGQTDAFAGSSSEDAARYKGIRTFSYRGVENLWGLFWQFADGACHVIHNAPTSAGCSTKRFECFDPSHYDEIGTAFVGNTERASVLMPHWECVYTYQGNYAGPNGYIRDFADTPVSGHYGIDVSLSAAGSNVSFIPDYATIPSANINPIEQERLCATYRGGVANGGAYVGPCYLYGSYDPSGGDPFFGFRLSYDPS